MPEHVEVRHGVYHDSVSLMQVSRRVGEVDGVTAALVAMGTELNLGFLSTMGFSGGHDAGANDLIVAVRADDEDALAAALAALEQSLAATSGGGGGFGEVPAARTTASALRAEPDAGLVLLSVPGEHVYPEAMDALTAGRHVMIFSDNVPLSQEVDLKTRGAERGLLVMGPDCGTAIVAGVGLGFANVAAPGSVGVVAASGTGAQQLTCLLDDAGVGVSHVIGVGGRDLKAEVGAIATLQALAALDADPATETIVVLSKPPAAAVADAVRAAAERCDTPVVLGFIGPDGDDLTTVTRRVVEARGATLAPRSWDADDPRTPRAGSLKGWFAGGTLAVEAVTIASAALGGVRANVGVDADPTLAGDLDAPGHVVVDLGEDDFTRGRPHPMIDQQLRLDRIRAAGKDPDAAVLLLDVVLGHGAHPDPGAELAPAIEEARATARGDGRDLAVVVSLCGTAGDPQDREAQARRLVAAGASVHTSNAEAARTAVALIEGSQA